MVIEYIRYHVPAGRHEEFESAWSQAATALDESLFCLSYEIGHGVEQPDHYVVRIEWRSLEEHERAFRGSPGFGPFFQAVKPFLDQIEEMKHYVPTAITSSS